MAFWKPAENPRTRPLRSWALDIGCAIVAGAASLAHFSFGQAAHPAHLSLAAGVIVAVLTAGALPLRRVWPGPVFVWTLLATAVLAQWPDRGALFPVALGISLYTVAAMMRRAEALAAAVLVAGVMLLVVAQDGTPALGAGGLGRRRVRGRGPGRRACTSAPAVPTLPRCATGPGGSSASATRAAHWPRRRNGPASPARCTTAWPTTSP